MTRGVERVDREELNVSRRELMAGTSVVAGAAVLGAVPSNALSQSDPDNEISGNVTDAQGAVENATVVAVPHDNSLDPLVTTTDANGDYVFSEADLYTGDELYHVIARDGTEADPRRGQENYPFLLANGGMVGVPDSGDLQVHYDASNKSDVSTTWTSEVGTDLSAVGSPAIESGERNGNNVVRYDGSDDGHDAALSSTVTQPFHWFIAFRFRDVGGSNSEAVWGARSTGTHVFANMGSDRYEMNSGGGGGSTLTGGTPDTDWHIGTAFFDGANSYFRIDGTQVLSGDPGAGDWPGMSLGYLANFSGNYAAIDVGEAFGYPSDKQSIESDAEQYLSGKWDITL